MTQSSIQQLQSIMAALRDPNSGCPWDVEQTFESLVPFTLEEAYEVADCIERGDYDALPGELGDLLLQVVFYAQIAEEHDLFDFERIGEEICHKLISRHPHVFADETRPTATQQSARWEALKAQERQSTENDDTSALAAIAHNLPALVRAEKIQKRAARVGFDWTAEAAVRAKVYEEFEEVLAAHKQGVRAEIEEEFGDLLFSCVNWGRFLGLDAETALRRATNKFETRFRELESQLQAEGRNIEQESAENLDRRWESVKLAQKKRAPKHP